MHDSPLPTAHPSTGGQPLVARPEDVDSIRHALLDWFDRCARDLPWRATDDPYAVWVSEVMLQQTRVDTVVPYWERWMERWPDVSALAAADLDEVLAGWEGLGYYRRARMLHRAAGVVRDRHGGRVPATRSALRELPGVGEYTAGAVASIAFGEPVPAVDGNVRRVLARLLDRPDPGAAELRNTAAALVDPDRPGDFNQALMELGATVCRPTSPSCGDCPVAPWCRARAAGVQEQRPRPRRRAPVPERAFDVTVPVRRGADGGWECRMVRRPTDGFLGGLWEFPTTPAHAADGATVPDSADAPAGGGAAAARGLDLPEITQAYSHFVGRYRPRVVRHRVGADRAGDAWVPLATLGDLAVAAAQRRIARAALDALATNPPEDP